MTEEEKKKFSLKEDLKKAKSELKEVSKVLPSKGKNPFQSKAIAPDWTKEELILRGIFGRGDKVMTNFDGRSLPKINKTLTSGGGLLKSGDYKRETAQLFGIRR